MGLADWFNRWRHTRGYGVHSPLAFRLVKRVVRPGRNVIYYGEEKMDDIFYSHFSASGHSTEGSHTMLKRARMLLRLVAELQPSYIWVSPGLPEIFSEAIRLAGCVIRVYDGTVYPADFSKTDMAVLYDHKLKKSDLKEIMSPGKSLVAFGLTPKETGWIKDLLKGGVMLEGRDSAVAVNTRDEGAHIYKIL